MRKVVGSGSLRTKSLFKYFNQFIDADRNGLDILILDEAHRIRETSADRYTPARFRSPWSDPRQDESLVPDVVIGDWSRPWNLRGDRALSGAPPAALWATDPAGFGQVGCVYTAQGFEYDWNGVIIGPDLIWRSDRLVAVREANKDPEFRKRVKVTDDEFDRLVRNVYKVLLTRGMIGTVVYSADRQTHAMLRSLID